MSDYAEELAIMATQALGLNVTDRYAHPAIDYAIREALAKAVEVARDYEKRCGGFGHGGYIADAITKLGARRP